MFNQHLMNAKNALLGHNNNLATAEAEAAVAQVEALEGVRDCLISLGIPLQTLANVVTRLEDQDIKDREEREKEDRNGTWETEWYVEAPPRKPVLFHNDDEAYAGAREARRSLGPSAVINVYAQEIKRYKREDVDPSVWEQDLDATGD